MSQVAPGEPARADVALLESLRAKLMSLVFTMEQMKREILVNPTQPPDWPTIQRSIATVSSTVGSIHDAIHKDPETLATFRALHAFPIPPFPSADPQLAVLVDAILSTQSATHEQDWIHSKMVKASEFARVPTEWDIEAKRPVEEEDLEMGGGDADETVLKRQKANSTEDDFQELWDAYDIVEEQLRQVTEEYADQSGDEDEEEEEMEDVEGTGTSVQAGGDASKQVDQKDQPMMSMGIVHRFMSTGSVVR